MFTDEISFPCFTGAVSVSLAVADEEVDDVLIVVVAVSYSVLSEDGCRLDEEVARFGSLCGSGELVCADEFNHSRLSFCLAGFAIRC